VQLARGGTAVANEDYLRESILSPAAKVVAGYQPIMPTFRGQVGEDDLLQLIAYIKTLQPAGGAAAGTGTASHEPDDDDRHRAAGPTT
jgi:cytochrome c oxidase subunit 2